MKRSKNVTLTTGQAVAALRNHLQQGKKLSQFDLAVRLGVRPQSIIRYEKESAPDLEVLSKLLFLALSEERTRKLSGTFATAIGKRLGLLPEGVLASALLANFERSPEQSDVVSAWRESKDLLTARLDVFLNPLQ